MSRLAPLGSWTRTMYVARMRFSGGRVLQMCSPLRFQTLRVFGWAVLAIITQLFVGMGWDQSTFGSYVGTVKDPTGSVVAGCKITVKNTGTAAERTATTDQTGSYVLVNIEPGNYEITMEAPGFQKAQFTQLVLTARQTVRIDGNLKLATQTEAVNVSVQAEAPINTEVSNIAETKLGRELIDLPVALGSRASWSTRACTTLTTQPGLESVLDALVVPDAREPSATGRSINSRPSLVSAIFETSVLMGASACTFTSTVCACEANTIAPSIRTVCLDRSWRLVWVTFWKP